MKRGDNLKLFPPNYESCNNFAHFIIIGTTSPETDYIQIARLLVPSRKRNSYLFAFEYILMEILLKIDLKSFKRDSRWNVADSSSWPCIFARSICNISVARINAILIRDSLENNRKWKIFKFTFTWDYGIRCFVRKS